MTAKEIGNSGEDAAAEFLEKNGLTVLKRNFYCRAGEIDIIAREEDTIVFAEVKTRISKEYGTPAEFVDYRKQEKIMKTAVLKLIAEPKAIKIPVIAAEL